MTAFKKTVAGSLRVHMFTKVAPAMRISERVIRRSRFVEKMILQSRRIRRIIRRVICPDFYGNCIKLLEAMEGRLFQLLRCLWPSDLKDVAAT